MKSSTEAIVLKRLTYESEYIMTTTNANANSETIQTAAAVSKADKARVIFREAYADPAKIPARKDIIARCVAEAGLTKAGAATYLQNYKDKQGLSVKKAPAVAATA